MNRIHCIIGIVIFIIFTCAAAGEAKDEKNLSFNERVVALTILGEARGEGHQGMYAVACVIERRIKESSVNHTAAEVCLQPSQFSIWNAGKGKVKKESQLDYLWEVKCDIVMYAKTLARHVCSKELTLRHSVVANANHYHRYDISPSWSRKAKPVAKVGDHYFFKLPWASNRK